MFEQVFQGALKQGPRLLFGAALTILLFGLVSAVHAVFTRTWWGILINLHEGLSSASLPFFCALIIQRIDLWTEKGGALTHMAPLPVPSWLTRHGARLLLGLALIYLLATALEFVSVVQQLMAFRLLALFSGPWLGTLWIASLLLFASLVLDRLDQWLAAVRPTYSD